MTRKRRLSIETNITRILFNRMNRI